MGNGSPGTQVVSLPKISHSFGTRCKPGHPIKPSFTQVQDNGLNIRLLGLLDHYTGGSLYKGLQA